MHTHTIVSMQLFASHFRSQMKVITVMLVKYLIRAGLKMQLHRPCRLQ